VNKPPRKTDFTQNRTATLRPYWLYLGLAIAAILFVPGWFGLLIISAIIVPKVLLPARLSIRSDAVVFSVWLAEAKVPWQSITSATLQGSGWSETITIETDSQHRIRYLNLGYFNDRAAIARAIVETAGHDHPLARAALQAVNGNDKKACNAASRYDNGDL
jgi:hypothetical protein